MKFARNLLVALFAYAALFTNSYANSSTYQFSGVVGNIEDVNLWYGGQTYVYPSGISIGTPVTATLNLSGDLSNLSGTMSFDLGGIYQGQINISGGALICGTNSNGAYGCDGNYTDVNGFHSGNSNYNDSALPYLGRVFLESNSNQGAVIDTDLPLAPLSMSYDGGSGIFVYVGLNMSPNSNKPPLTTSLSDLPISSIDFALSSYGVETRTVSCPACIEGYTYVTTSQGWQLGGSSTALSAVPEPSSNWLFVSGLIVVMYAAARKSSNINLNRSLLMGAAEIHDQGKVIA